MNSLTNKTAIITGGASGIGRETALTFARAGAEVCILDINDIDGQIVVNDIHEAGGNAHYIHCDVTNPFHCEKAINQTIENFGKVDILCNNAGIIRRASVLDTSEADWDRIMAVNVKSVFLMSKVVIPYMQKSGGGAIINTSSGWGLVGGPQAAAYCAAKAAVVNLSKAMAIDLGPQNIRVNCICPGDTDTAMLRSEAIQLNQEETSFLAEAAKRPLGRIGTPQEIANAILFLASDAASYITGSVLVIDGGGLAG